MGPKLVGTTNRRGESRYQGRAGVAVTVRMESGGWAWKGPQHAHNEMEPAASRAEANIKAMGAAMGDDR